VIVTSSDQPGWSDPASDQLIVHDVGDGTLRLIGEIDMYTSSILRRRLETDPPVTVLDLRDVTFLDSTGLIVLVNATRDHADGGLVLRSPTGAVSRVLELAGIDQLFRIERPESATE
jgi:anti-sigma B factor antagonist